MKYLLLLYLLSYFSSLYSQSEFVIINEKIENYTLVKILNNAQRHNLNELSSGIQKDLSLKLYSVGINRPAYQTEMIVEHEYYLAVSEFDEYADQAVFYLGKFGEIINISWVDFKKMDSARIKFDVINHPVDILKFDPTLKKISKTIQIQITTKDIILIQ